MVIQIEQLSMISHHKGIPWHEAKIPRRWHFCWSQTWGLTKLHVVERCACGARRTDGQVWVMRNSRRASARNKAKI